MMVRCVVPVSVQQWQLHPTPLPLCDGEIDCHDEAVAADEAVCGECKQTAWSAGCASVKESRGIAYWRAWVRG